MDVHTKPATRYRASVSHLKDAQFASKGWRSFFTYRDLGVKDATEQDYDVRIVRAGGGEHEMTGWHYHVLNIQVVYCIGGFEIIALEDGRIVVVPGTCLQIPPGYVHNEIAYAPDMEMFVLSSPAAVTTVGVDDPPGWDGDAVARLMPVETSPARLTTPWVWADAFVSR